MNRASGCRFGLTLIEVLLSMAIMAMALAALAQLQNGGARAALNATLVAEASVLCQSEMDAWLANGSSRAVLDNQAPIAGAEGWFKRLTLQPIPELGGSGLSLLTVEVYRSRQSQPLFKLSRWVAVQADEGDHEAIDRPHRKTVRLYFS